MAKQRRVVIPRLLIGRRRRLWINPQNAILLESGMDVKMKMRHFLERRFTDGMPEAQSFVRKCRRDGARHAGERGHERSTTGFIKLPHVSEVLARDDQRMAGMELPQIDKSHGEFVLENKAGPASALDDVAKDAFAATCSFHGTTRPRLIFAGKSKPINPNPRLSFWLWAAASAKAATAQLIL